jgi:hypothetical protein
MTYGWARAELIGALTNACFLASLCLYVALECIPLFIKPKPMEVHFIDSQQAIQTMQQKKEMRETYTRA